MYEIGIGDVYVEVDWYLWRSYPGERLFCGQPYTGPVYAPVVVEVANDVEQESEVAA